LLVISLTPEDDELQPVQVHLHERILRQVEPEVGDVRKGDGHQLLHEPDALLLARHRPRKGLAPVADGRLRWLNGLSGGGHLDEVEVDKV